MCLVLSALKVDISFVFASFILVLELHGICLLKWRRMHLDFQEDFFAVNPADSVVFARYLLVFPGTHCLPLLPSFSLTSCSRVDLSSCPRVFVFLRHCKESLNCLSLSLCLSSHLNSKLFFGRRSDFHATTAKLSFLYFKRWERKERRAKEVGLCFFFASYSENSRRELVFVSSSYIYLFLSLEKENKKQFMITWHAKCPGELRGGEEITFIMKCTHLFTCFCFFLFLLQKGFYLYLEGDFTARHAAGIVLFGTL